MDEDVLVLLAGKAELGGELRSHTAVGDLWRTGRFDATGIQQFQLTATGLTKNGTASGGETADSGICGCGGTRHGEIGASSDIGRRSGTEIASTRARTLHVGDILIAQIVMVV